MKAFQAARQTIQDTEYLIKMMQGEIDDLRVMLYRYNKEFGNVLARTEIKDKEFPSHLSQRFAWDKEALIVEFIDYKKLGMDSKYMNILSEIKKLS